MSQLDTLGIGRYYTITLVDSQTGIYHETYYSSLLTGIYRITSVYSQTGIFH